MIIPPTDDQRTSEIERPERRGISTRSVIDEAKAKVSTIDLADRLCGPGQLRRVGEKWVARCPLPEHADRSPSFTVYPGTDSFFCFGCLVGGDVVELARHAWGYGKHEVAIAAADLLREFGHELPQRSPAWYRKQERQRQTRDAVEQTRKNSVRRRLFEHLVLPHLDTIENSEERNRELERAWDDFQRLLP
jgi:DNA primase